MSGREERAKGPRVLAMVWPLTFPDVISLFQVSGLAGSPGPVSMKLLCLVAVVGCLLVPPAQGNKVREVSRPLRVHDHPACR